MPWNQPFPPVEAGEATFEIVLPSGALRFTAVLSLSATIGNETKAPINLELRRFFEWTGTELVRAHGDRIVEDEAEYELYKNSSQILDLQVPQPPPLGYTPVVYEEVRNTQPITGRVGFQFTNFEVDETNEVLRLSVRASGHALIDPEVRLYCEPEDQTHREPEELPPAASSSPRETPDLILEVTGGTGGDYDFEATFAEDSAAPAYEYWSFVLRAQNQILHTASIRPGGAVTGSFTLNPPPSEPFEVQAEVVLHHRQLRNEATVIVEPPEVSGS